MGGLVSGTELSVTLEGETSSGAGETFVYNLLTRCENGR